MRLNPDLVSSLIREATSGAALLTIAGCPLFAEDARTLPRGARTLT